MAKFLQKNYFISMYNLPVFGIHPKNLISKDDTLFLRHISIPVCNFSVNFKSENYLLENVLKQNLPQSNICRNFNTTSIYQKNFYSVTFAMSSGEKHTVKGKEGDSLLDVVRNNDIDISGYGACEGTMSCSTCHLIFKNEDYEKIESPLTDEEMDMLTTAQEFCDTSRLGCQVLMTKELDGTEVQVPKYVIDARTS